MHLLYKGYLLDILNDLLGNNKIIQTGKVIPLLHSG